MSLYDEEHTVILINRQTNLPEQRYHLVLSPLHLQHTLSHTLSHTHSLSLVCYARLHNNIILIHSILKGYSPLKWLCKKYNCHCCHCIDDYETGDDGMYNVCV